MAATVDKSLSAVVYVNSGSEANDIAWRTAKAWTGHSGGMCMEYAYHGNTDAIIKFSPSNAAASWNVPSMRLIPAPDDYRGVYKRGEVNLAGLYANLADAPIAELAQSEFGIAAAMVDSAFMTNGMIEAPTGYLKAVVDKIRAAGVELVRDRKTLEPATTETKRLFNLVRDQGALIGTEGVLGNILKLRPPIVFQPEHVDIAIDALERALRDL